MSVVLYLREDALEAAAAVTASTQKNLREEPSQQEMIPPSFTVKDVMDVVPPAAGITLRPYYTPTNVLLCFKSPKSPKPGDTRLWRPALPRSAGTSITQRWTESFPLLSLRLEHH